MTADCISWSSYPSGCHVYTVRWQSSTSWHPQDGFSWGCPISDLNRCWYVWSVPISGCFLSSEIFCRETWCLLSIRTQPPQDPWRDPWSTGRIFERITDPCMELGGVALFPHALQSSNIHISTSRLHFHPTKGPPTWGCEFSLYMCSKQSKQFWIGPPAANS